MPRYDCHSAIKNSPKSACFWCAMRRYKPTDSSLPKTTIDCETQQRKYNSRFQDHIKKPPRPRGIFHSQQRAGEKQNNRGSAKPQPSSQAASEHSIDTMLNSFWKIRDTHLSREIINSLCHHQANWYNFKLEFKHLHNSKEHHSCAVGC